MTLMDTEKLIQLYQIAVNEEHYFLSAHQSRIAFYSGIIPALIVATITGILQSSQWHHLALLCVGPLLIFILSRIAIGGTRRFYQRFIEAVTVRAKIEQKLGLTEKQPSDNTIPDSYWQTEPIIPPRHISSRTKYKSSEDFINAHLTQGYQFWAVRWFNIFQIIGLAMLLSIMTLAILKFFAVI